MNQETVGPSDADNLNLRRELEPVQQGQINWSPTLNKFHELKYATFLELKVPEAENSSRISIEVISNKIPNEFYG